MIRVPKQTEFGINERSPIASEPKLHEEVRELSIAERVHQISAKDAGHEQQEQPARVQDQPLLRRLLQEAGHICRSSQVPKL